MTENIHLFEETLRASAECRKKNPYLNHVLDSLNHSIETFVLYEKGKADNFDVDNVHHFGLVFGRDIDGVDQTLSDLIHRVQRAILGYSNGGK